MKNNHSPARFIVAILFLVLSFQMKAQINTKYYYLGYSNHIYQPVVGGTILDSAAQVSIDSVWTNQPIGFTFNFNCQPYTSLGISSNGFIWFGNTNPSANEYNPLSSSVGSDGIVAAYATNLIAGTSNLSLGGAAPNACIRYATSGTAPNRQFTVEWRKVSSIVNDNNSTDMQIRLFEGSDKIEIAVWDWPYFIQGSTTYGQLGMRGADNSDFVNRSVNSSHNWCNSIAGTANTDDCAIYTTFQCAYPTGPGLKAICYTYVPIGCNGNWSIQGKVYRDTDNDCNTSNEPSLNNIKVNLYDNTSALIQQVYTFGNGNYYFNAGLGTYTVQVDTDNIPLMVLCPSTNSYTVTLDVANPTIDSLNFGLVCDTVIDLGINSMCVTAGWPFFPTMTTTVSVLAGDFASMVGFSCNTTNVSGDITLTFAGNVAYIGPAPGALTPDTVIGNTVTWHINNFAAINFNTAFKIKLVVDSFALFFDQICLTSTLTLDSATDDNLANNTNSACYYVFSSFDPNDKFAYPSVLHEQDQWVTYDIHFQNTGNAPAINITILDTLDSNADVSTFDKLTSSYACITQVIGNKIKFFFPNIMLPDSGTSQSLSKGYVQYRVKMNGNLPNHTTVHNTAGIYFDFNIPVITNDATVNYCVSTSGNEDVQICNGDSIKINGVWYTQAGAVTTVIAGPFECDSTVTTNISVSNVNEEVTQSAAVLTANQAGASYQWYDCSNNQPIANATSQTFTATENGSYSVEITSGGCSKMSECLTVQGLSTKDITVKNNFTLYPNPAQQNVLVSYEGEMKDAMITLTDITGRIIFAQPAKNNTAISLQNISAGSYNVELLKEGKVIGVKKLVVIK